MKASYPVIQLGDLCDVLDSKRRPITKRDRVEGEYPYYGATGILGYVEGFIFDEPLVLIGEDGAKWGAGENTAFSAEGRYWVNNHAHVIRPHRQKLLDSWLIYQLNLVDLSPFITGLTVPKLNQAKMREIPIIVPPLDEQRRIVAVLDKAFANIATATANAKKNLTNARALFESTLSAIFDQRGCAWPQFRLSEVGKTITGNTPKTGDKENFGDFLPFIKPGNFLSNGSIAYDGDGLSEKGAQASRVIPAGSALMVCIGATIGKSGYTERKVTANQQINAVVPKNGVVGKFLYYQFLTPSFQRSVRDGSGQATLPIISKSKWSDLAVRLPNSPQEQVNAVNTLDDISEKSQQLLDVSRRKLAALTELKQSLLQKAFAGELT